jgi:queuosine precursor transporter
MTRKSRATEHSVHRFASRAGYGYDTALMSERRPYRYYDLVMVGFVTVLVCSNLVGPAKIAQIDLPILGAFVFGAGVLFFPISYVFGDILTEVYGYARSRRVIWAGFGALAFASLMAWVVVELPPAPFWKNQAAYETAFGSTWRIAAASLVAFVAGEFVNSYVLARMKVLTQGRWLWTRTIGSTVFGEGVDSLLFYPLAFYDTGIIPNDKLPLVMLAQFLTKVGVEVLLTPVTYKVVGWLKRAEQEDFYDRHTDFNPFRIRA